MATLAKRKLFRPVSLKRLPKLNTERYIIALFILSLIVVVQQGAEINNLNTENNALYAEVERLEPYVQLSEDQTLEIAELNNKNKQWQAHSAQLEESNTFLVEQAVAMEESITILEQSLTVFETEIETLEKNLNLLADIKEKTGN